MSLDFASICSFCAELTDRADKSEPLIQEFFPGPSGRILEGDDAWIIMPTIGPIVPGHLLLVSRRHETALANMSRDEVSALEQWMRRLDSRMCRSSQHLFFEHGSMGPGKEGGACTDHTHIHFLPIRTGRLRSYIDLEGEQVDGMGWLDNQRSLGKPYVYLRDTDGSGWRFEVPSSGVQCQYMRRRVAQMLDCPEVWDWVVYPRVSEMIETAKLYKAEMLHNDGKGIVNTLPVST